MLNGDPNINDKNMTLWMTAEVTRGNENLFRGFVRENPGAKKTSNHTSMKGREPRQEK